MKKILNKPINWKQVTILSIVSAIVTAGLNCIPLLYNTSFTAPAETVELWVVLAVFIIVRCSSYKDAVLKTFVFFLISQPLIYLLEVPFKPDGWALFKYYPFWGIFTVLTIPGAAIAYRVKKGDVISSLILSVANIMIIISGFNRVGMVLYEFPRFVVTLVFCVVMPFVIIFTILEEKRPKAVAACIAALVIIGSGCVYILTPKDSISGFALDEAGWSVSEISDPGIEVEIDTNNELSVISHKNGKYTFILESEDGRRVCYDVSVEGGKHTVNITGPREAD